MQYCVFMYGKSWGHGDVLFHNVVTLREAKEEVSEKFSLNSSYWYAEIYDRSTGKTIVRTRTDSNYKTVED